MLSSVLVTIIFFDTWTNGFWTKESFGAFESGGYNIHTDIPKQLLSGFEPDTIVKAYTFQFHPACFFFVFFFFWGGKAASDWYALK